MVSFLTKIFIKDYNNTTSSAVRQAYGILCGAVGIAFNILLFIGKFLAGLFSNSIAITADAFNNLSDAASSVITLIGFKMAGQKPDPDHPFGHGRIEYLTGAFVSLAILVMAFELMKSSVSKILHPEEMTFSLLIIVILIVSIIVKLYMSLYNTRISKKINSAAMKATAIDSLSDSLATTAVLIATLISHFTGVNIDGYCGILVGLFIFYAGFSAIKDTINPLLGQSPDPEFVQNIEDIVLSYDIVLGIHDLIVHDYGPGRRMVSLHAEVPASGNLLTLHDTIDNIEHELRNTLQCDAVIHMDPICNDDKETLELKEYALNSIHKLSAELTLHDFRLVKGPTHTNIIFDVVVPYNFTYSDSEIREYLSNEFSVLNQNYYTVIDIDKAYR
ncbi:MAG: cation transporter [Lachnospiraceae bacterium]|nr:cation transporter [Lachnospiraceae bacterium]